MSDYFSKQIDTGSRQAMAEFIADHFRYYTMNSWNRVTSYANNVKIHNLGLTSEQASRAYDLLLDADIDMSLFWDGVHDIIQDFLHETGCTIAFNGRSDGYMVLYATEIRNGRRVTLSRGIGGYDIEELLDPDGWSMDDLEQEVELVRAFDRVCDDVRDLLIHVLETGRVETEVETKVVTVEHRTLTF